MISGARRGGVVVACVGAVVSFAIGCSSAEPSNPTRSTAPTPSAGAADHVTPLPEFTVNTAAPFNARGSLPPMGWSSWAAFQVDVSADRLIQQAEVLVDSGLASAGYRYVNLDGGWMLPSRNADGELVVDRTKFPEGLQPVVDRVHELGLQFGLYVDASEGKACGDYMTGSYQHVSEDFAYFRSLGIDYLKVDGCYVHEIADRPFPELARDAFGRWSNAILESGEPIHLSQGAPAYAYFYAPDARDKIVEWSATISNSWRTGADIVNADGTPEAQWQSILTNLEYTLPLADHAGPGHFNDPDFLIVGNGIAINEARVQAGAWAMMAAPLLVSTDLTDLAAEELALLTDPALIAIDQDPLGVQGRVLERQGDVLVMLKPLDGGGWALLAANLGDAAAPYRVPLAPLAAGGRPVRATVSDVFTDTSTDDVSVLEGVLPPRDAALFVVDARPND